MDIKSILSQRNLTKYHYTNNKKKAEMQACSRTYFNMPSTIHGGDVVMTHLTPVDLQAMILSKGSPFMKKRRSRSNVFKKSNSI